MPEIHVRLFAGLHDLIGKRDLVLEVPAGATVGTLRERLVEEYPMARPFMKTLVCAVDEEYVPIEHVLREGDDVALIPPISGGCMFEITRERLDPRPLVEAVRRDEAGAIAVFYGVVRNENLGRSVQYLEYDAYVEMALRKMRQVADEVRARHPAVTGLGVLHRIGRLEIGETSLLVAVSSPHRAEAFAACHFAVDQVKETVPIWKKEVWDDGSEWIEGHVPEVPDRGLRRD